ncbi:MAG: cold shock domain-containing protein [Patescibacteria group bacterium]
MEKGYGFIKTGHYEEDIFFHAKNVIGANFQDLTEGDTVEFLLRKNNDGRLEAVRVGRTFSDN